MQIIDRGCGEPLVMIPGIQGRWEYMSPALDTLARSFRVITFALAGERTSRRTFDPDKGLDNFVEQIDAVLDDRGLVGAAMCGISFGGLIALRYAARRPERTAALLLVSTPSPAFRLKRRHRVYARAPWLFGPAFLAEIPRRVGPELERTFPAGRDRRRFSWGQIRTFLRAPWSLSRMAERSALVGRPDSLDDCRLVSAPTLVVAGDPVLDRLVPADGTSDYVRLIAGARGARIDNSGHLGYITRPEVFAGIVREFLDRPNDAAA
ncbi:MAG: hypothetical protein A3H97_21105 [Acidobacteria bacterium RIFCSPLOWO2_02_FULL_65_29]|nr:MAG: hypothetical protein A3H97_21105 [Acidobacteria bacterium RIFCSPLOWO2_02_FULL_65_29]